MKIYGPLFSNFRHFHRRHSDVCFRWCPVDIVPRSGGEVAAFSPYCFLRQYSNVGVNRIPASADDVPSDRLYDIPQNIRETNPRGWNQGNEQNSGYFQEQPSSTSHHYVTNDQISSTPNLVNQIDNVYAFFNGRQNVEFRQINNNRNISNGMLQQSTSSMYMGNGVAYPSTAYYQEHVPAVAGSPLANSSGYYDVHTGYNQNFNESQNPHMISQQQVGTSHNDRCDDGVEEALTEFDNFCKEWDLENAVKYIMDLSEKGVILDMSRYLNLIDACGKGKALKEAKDVHQHLIRYSSPMKVSILNRILEMHGKCGSMEDAYSIFKNMPERNLTTWDIMITWFAKNGLGEEAIDIFTTLKEVGLKPDGQMFPSIFSACGVIGDVAEGMLHFDSMIKIYGITPTMEHYASIVHMFGSACDLDGALEFIEKMPVEPSIDVWVSLMNIARVQGNIEIGDRCAQIVEQLDSTHLSKLLKDGFLPVDPDAPNKKVKKYNPYEHIKHGYRAGDKSHPESDKIYSVLKCIKESMKEAGYIPETKFVLHDIDPEGKEEAIMAHSERLAGTTALLKTAARYPMRIIKNLRVCGDCHNYFKILSDLVCREIVMRDAKRFHHFKHGKCSCNDYW